MCAHPTQDNEMHTAALPHRLRLDIANTSLNLTAEQERKIIDVLPWRAPYMRAFAV